MFIKVGTGWVLAPGLWFKSSCNSPKAHLNAGVPSRHPSPSALCRGRLPVKGVIVFPGAESNNRNLSELFAGCLDLPTVRR